MLDVRDLHAGYGRMEILHGLDLHVDAEEIVSLIGANGAGKTTTLRALAGMVTPTQGSVELEGTTSARRCDPTRSCAAAWCTSPRTVSCSVRCRSREPRDGRLHASSRPRARESLDRVFDLFPILAERRTQKADTMSGGQQQMLAIGRALMARPSPADPRRAVRRARAQPRPAGARRDHPDPGDRRDGADRRAERRAGAGDLGPRLRHRERLDRPRGHRRRARRRRPGSASAYLGI